MVRVYALQKTISSPKLTMQLQKTISSILSSLSHHQSNYHRLLKNVPFLLHSSPITTKSQPPTEPHFIVDYLTTTVGLSPDRAAKASRQLSRLASPEKPDAVLRFLAATFPLIDAARLRTLLSWYPPLLLCSVSKTLRPRAAALQRAGFSAPLLSALLQSNPTVLIRRDVLPTLTFWRDFFAGDDKKLLNLVKRNRNLIAYDIEKKIVPNIALLRDYGLSDRDISIILTLANGFITRSPESVRSLIERAEALGFARGTGMFVHGLTMVARLTVDSLKRKLEFFRSIGWSEAETRFALLQFPTILLLAKKNVERKMSFLVEEVGFMPSEVAFRPALLAYSLEKRLIPRYHVIKILKDLGIKQYRFTSLIYMSDKKFAEKYILPHREEVPGLHETFLADRGSRKQI